MINEAQGVYDFKTEACRRFLWFYCRVKNPKFYSPERKHLKEFCEKLQEFTTSNKKAMVVNMPPRHGKSFTASHFIEWLLGNYPDKKIMMGSYNDILSTRFSKLVRDDISEIKGDADKIVYSDVFPDVKIKSGDGAMNLWSIDGYYNSYLATSPQGSATGFGADYLVIDDLIKSSQEAYSDMVKEKHWDWFTNTMLSRLEEGGKIIVIMTRWASDDLAGRVLDYFRPEQIEHINYTAVQKDGSMLCESILSKESCDQKKRLMGLDIWSANYQQEPIDIKGRLYTSFKTYTDVPRDMAGYPLFTSVKSYCDTADEGSDYLCNIIYGVYENDAYVLDILYTQKPMEYTESETAKRLASFNVRIADIESNNGGRGFARAVEKQLKETYHYHRCKICWFHQGENKRARILSNSTAVMDHIFFPANWQDKWTEFYDHLHKFQREGKNAHDDAEDALTGVIEKMNRTGIKINPIILR